MVPIQNPVWDSIHNSYPDKKSLHSTQFIVAKYDLLALMNQWL